MKAEDSLGDKVVLRGFKGAFRLCNFVNNFLVAREKLLRKLQARAIFRTRRGWIFIAWIFIARNFIAQ